MPWDGILEGLDSGDYEMVMSGMSATPSRERVVDFSDPYEVRDETDVAESLYVAASADADLSGRVAAQVSTIQAESLADPVLFDTFDDAVAAVLADAVDAVLLPDDNVDHQIGQHPALVIVGDPLPIEFRTAIAVADDNDDLRVKLNAAIAAAWSDGIIEELHAKWNPDE